MDAIVILKDAILFDATCNLMNNECVPTQSAQLASNCTVQHLLCSQNPEILVNSSLTTYLLFLTEYALNIMLLTGF